MVPEVTLIPNVSINIVTKFQVSIFKNDEVRGGGYFNPPLRRISWQRGLRGIGLKARKIHNYRFYNSWKSDLTKSKE